MFKVEGGIFKNTKFEEIEEGTKERYGPFENYKAAFDAWQAGMWAKVDVCCHRLFIKEM